MLTSFLRSSRRFASKKVLAGNIEDLVNGQVKSVQIGENVKNTIALCRVGDRVYAVGGACPHASAPLSEGYLDGYNLHCPYHTAKFDIRSGDNLSPPAFDRIPTYDTTISPKGDIHILIPEEVYSKVTEPYQEFFKRDERDTRHYVVVGGGAAGVSCVETLRKIGYTGKLTMISKDMHLPYDRVMLSKNLMISANKAIFRNADFYKEYGIEFILKSSVEEVDFYGKMIVPDNRNPIKYDKLLLATGSHPYVPENFKFALNNYKHVYTLRTLQDLHNMKATVETAKDVVIAGGSFLGLEVANYLKTKFTNKGVTVVDIESNPMSASLGHDVASILVEKAKRKGINVITGRRIEKITPSEDKISRVEVVGEVESDIYPADMLLIATGAKLNTQFLPASMLLPDGSIKVNSCMQTSAEDVYAAGDIATFPSKLTESYERLEHWSVAQEQGKIAAYNMFGVWREYNSVPFFWTNQAGIAHFTGFSRDSDYQFTIRGRDEKGERLAVTLFFKQERCIGASMTGHYGLSSKMLIGLERSVMPLRREVVDGNMELGEILKRIYQSNPCLCYSSNK